MVWEGSVYAGGIYAGHGKHGRSTEGLLQDLPPVWEIHKKVRSHKVTADEEAAVEYLQNQGVFGKRA